MLARVSLIPRRGGGRWGGGGENGCLRAIYSGPFFPASAPFDPTNLLVGVPDYEYRFGMSQQWRGISRNELRPGSAIRNRGAL